MTEMIQEPNDESEVDADALIELVDAPPDRGSHTPPPPPASRKSSVESKPAATSAPTLPSPPALGTPPGSMPESVRPSGRLSSLPLAPPRPGAPSLNPITDRPSTPPRASSVPRAPAMPASLPAPVEKVDEPLAELKEQLDLAHRALSGKDGELRTLLAQRDALILELESFRHHMASRELAVKELEFAGLAREARIRELEKDLAEAHERAGDSDDDLKLIRGIGPAFERELKRLGIRKFAQIAAWTSEDVDTIAKKIKAKPERIRRDDWIARAAELTRGLNQP
jgi:predicted flap endonuclease-1-like 5' DNA nuclease